jgi:hypothetical protein
LLLELLSIGFAATQTPETTLTSHHVDINQPNLANGANDSHVYSLLLDIDP